MKKNYFAQLVPALLMLFIFLVYLVLGFNVEYGGDDLAYYINGRDYYGGSLLYYPQWVLRHWIFNNGRLANYLAPLLLFHSPRWLLVGLNALATASFFALMLPAMRVARNRVTASVFVIALLAFTMSWWDATLMFDVSLNYVWMSAIALAFILVFRKAETMKSAFFPSLLAFLAANTHEGLSLPLLVGFAVYYILGKRFQTLSRVQKRMLVWFTIGVVIEVCSPGTLMRGTTYYEPDAPLPVLLAVSCFYVFLMVLFLMVMLLVNRGEVRKKLSSPILIWVVAAFVSTCIVALGGIIGRSGWFAQMFALIAFGQWFAGTRLVLRRGFAAVLTTLLTAAIVCHYLAAIHSQRKAYQEYHAAIEAFKTSADGTVFQDVTPRVDYPWYVLMKVFGAPSLDDVYPMQMASKAWRGGKVPFNVIPTQAKSLMPFSGKRIHLSNGMVLSDRMPREARDTIAGGFGRRYLGDSLCIPFTYEGRGYVLTVPPTKDPSEW